MKPAICKICAKPSIDEIPPNQGDWIQFADYEPPSASSIGHPRGLEYFCDEHLSAAKRLESMASADALAELRKQFEHLPTYKSNNASASLPPWWKRLFFSRRRPTN